MLEPRLWGQTDLGLIPDFPLFLVSVYLLWLFHQFELVPLSVKWVEVCLAHCLYEDYSQLKAYLPLCQHKVAIQNGNCQKHDSVFGRSPRGYFLNICEMEGPIMRQMPYFPVEEGIFWISILRLDFWPQVKYTSPILSFS